uniref:Shisa N-terminal domain-containing protein n=1 Tax=Strigamia maritima TaxID=126957 RepID=T1J0F7_STRMM
MSVQMRPNEDHEVLGSDFCSGYTDSFGKWNTAFHCPTLDITEAVYCCGSSNYKYCCTKKDEVQQEIPNITLVIGVVSGICLIIIIVTILSCVFCSCCTLNKKRQSTISGDRLTPSSLVPGPLYQLHCSSTASGVANMYSYSNQNSSVTTPIDTTGLDLDYSSHMHLPRNCTSPSLLQLKPAYIHTSPRLPRAVTLDQCHLTTEGESSEQPEDSLSPCHGSSPSMSISIRDHVTKGQASERQMSSCRNNGQAPVKVSPNQPRDEVLYRSTKF